MSGSMLLPASRSRSSSSTVNRGARHGGRNPRCELELRTVEACEARNCLTHNHGIVVPARCTDGHLRLSWLAPTARMRGTESDIEVPLESMIGVATGEEMIVEFLHAERVMNLAPGDALRLSHQDLREILYFFGTLVIPATRARPQPVRVRSLSSQCKASCPCEQLCQPSWDLRAPRAEIPCRAVGCSARKKLPIHPGDQAEAPPSSS